MKSKELVTKWEPTGLLGPIIHLSSDVLRQKRLQKTKQVLIAEALEECANLMIKDKTFKMLEENQSSLWNFHGMALPIVRRIFDEGNGLKAEYEKMKEIYIELKDDFMPKIRHSNAIDLEAELCALIGETYVERYGENKEGEPDEA